MFFSVLSDVHLLTEFSKRNLGLNILICFFHTALFHEVISVAQVQYCVTLHNTTKQNQIILEKIIQHIFRHATFLQGK